MKLKEFIKFVSYWPLVVIANGISLMCYGENQIAA